VKFEILEVKNTQPGQKPSVTLKITDKSGFPVETSQMSSLSLVVAGPNTDFAGYWSESVLKTPSNNGVVNYTFTRGIPEDAKGSFTVGVEGYRNMTLQPGTTKEVSVRDVGFNQLVAVAVTDTAPVARRQVVTQEACNSCHGSIALHGTFRQNVQYCVMCHNANWTTRLVVRLTSCRPNPFTSKRWSTKFIREKSWTMISRSTGSGTRPSTSTR
jgi:OmcA/MtrC family decaheme c-type cytochrome